MKNKEKNFLGLMLSFLLALFCMAISSCDDDDDVSPSSNIEQMLKSNVWVSTNEYDCLLWGDLEISISKQHCTLFFFDNGYGIGKSYEHEDDTYFGSSTNVFPFRFSYSVNGSSVIINNTTYKYKDGALYSLDGKKVFTKRSITSDDNKWLESAKFYVMDDDERLDFDFAHGLVERTTFDEGSQRETVIELHLHIDGSQKAFSRGVTSITAKYSVSGGSLPSKNIKNVLVISEDKDYDASITTTVVTPKNMQATVTAVFETYDSKKQRSFNSGSLSYTVPSNSNEGNEGNDNNGPNSGDSGALTGTINGHEYVDLGLSVNWATCNIGATVFSDLGNYFCFGSYKQDDDYASSGFVERTNGAKGCISKTSYDTAQQLWSKPWRMPTIEEIEELAENCKYQWTKKNGIPGCLLTSKINNQSIFIPAGGEYFRDDYASEKTFSLTEKGSMGLFMSGSVKYIDTYNMETFTGTIGEYAYGGYFRSHYTKLETIGRRIDYFVYGYHYKNNIRPVVDKN